MPEQVLRNVGIWIDGRNMAGVSNSVGTTLEAEAPESTSFADEWRTRSEGGLKTAGLTLEGWYDRGEIDAAQFSSIGEDGSAMIAPAGQTPGAVAHIVPYAASAFELGASVGELAAFTFAGEGNGEPVRAQVLDVRENETADDTTTRLNLGAIATGETLEVWVHITRRAGRVQIELESATTGTTTFITTRDVEAGINSTRLHKFSVAGPITDEWWQLKYDFNVGSPDFDFAAAGAIS